MKERGFLEGTEIPEIVDRKCSEAYDMIYKECEQKNKNIITFNPSVSDGNEPEGVIYSDCEHDNKRKKRISFGKCAAIAACAAVFVTAAIPVVAGNVPSLKSAFSFISGETYTKDPAEKNDLTKYAVSVNESKESKCADIVMQSVYCDGNNLSVSLVLTPKDDVLRNLTGVQGKLEVTLGGKEINRNEYSEQLTDVCFTAGDDGNYYSIIHYSDLNVTDSAELKIHIYDIKGVNGYVLNWVPNDDFSGTYVPEDTGVLEGDFEFEHTVKPDTSRNRTYEVNETQDGITLERITVTPFETSVYISGYDQYTQCIRVKDQDENELEGYGYYSDNLDSAMYSTPLKTAEKLYVEVFSLYEDDFPTQYSFEVPIEEGFADKYDVEYELDQSKITYNPPMEELDRQAEERYNKQIESIKDIKACPVGTTIKVPYCDADDNGEHIWYMDIRITGSEVAEVSDYDIEPERIEWYEESRGQSIDDAKLLVVHYELENTCDEEKDFYFWGLSTMSKTFSYDEDYTVTTDGDYISYSENGGKGKYRYSFSPKELKEITVGYILPEYVIDQGFYVYASTDSYGEGFTTSKLLDGTANLYEIK